MAPSKQKLTIPSKSTTKNICLDVYQIVRQILVAFDIEGDKSCRLRYQSQQ